MPTATDYSQAIQNLRVAVADEELKAGEVAVDPLGLPLQYAGNFGVVFQVRCPRTGNTWAVKCFTKAVEGLQQRYRVISEHLQGARLPFMVDFQYQERGILVGGCWHPLLKMRWVEGENLNHFVAANLDRPGTLRQLLGLWVKLAERLRGAEVTHADLQHGNVLLVPAGDREGHRLMLVDYDGMYVPALALHPSGERGHPAYQHPQRLRDGVYSAEVDRFSHLAIYCALRCLMAGGRRLWERLDNGDNLLFRETDFAKPGESELLHRLWAARDEELRALVGHLILATQMPLDRVPLLREVLAEGTTQPLSDDQERQVKALMGREASQGGAVARVTPGDLSSWLQSPASEEGLAKPLSPAELASTWGNVAPSSPAIPAGQAPWGTSAPGAPPARLSSRSPGVKPAASTSPQAISAAHQEMVVDLGHEVQMTLVLLPAGAFVMGSPSSDRDAESVEKPAHRVQITKPFYLGKYEVTQQQWLALMGGNPSRFQGATNPVEQVSWNDCQDFLRKLNQQYAAAKGTFRLPTEAEWEYACRAGSSTRWCFGDEEASLEEYAWYSVNSARTTHPVGQKRPNAWGLHDMHGNVWEWCSDWYDREYYQQSPGSDPTGPTWGSSRVYRGGSWVNHAGGCRSADRRSGSAGGEVSLLGFRVLRVAVGGSAE